MTHALLVGHRRHAEDVPVARQLHRHRPTPPEDMYGKTMRSRTRPCAQWFAPAADEPSRRAGGGAEREAKRLLARRVARASTAPDGGRRGRGGSSSACTARTSCPTTCRGARCPTAIRCTCRRCSSTLGRLALEARRRIARAAVRLEGEPVATSSTSPRDPRGRVLQVGRRRFVRFARLIAAAGTVGRSIARPLRRAAGSATVPRLDAGARDSSADRRSTARLAAPSGHW